MNRSEPSRGTVKWLSLLLLATVVFNWKTLLTHQFSLLTEWEGVSQGYAWYNFWINSVRHWTWPVWDPYTFSGFNFAGEMQTAAFYPVHLLLVLIPYNRNGVFSPQAYHIYIAFGHFLAACFMFALARHLRLSRFAAFVAGVCFSMGGFVARMGWPHQLDASLWLPLVFLCLLRALEAERWRDAVVRAALGGLALGMSLLAGGLHVTIMETLAVAGGAAWYAASRRAEWLRCAAIVGVLVGIGIAAGAVQLLVSAEYSPYALRFLGDRLVGAVPGSERIPYAGVRDGMWPHGFLMLLFPTGFGSNGGPGEIINPYLGVFPLLLALIAIWKSWSAIWVRFLAGLAVFAFLYAMGSFSLLNGALYAVIPFLSLAREAGRFVYLSSFALSLLAAYGADALFAAGAPPTSWEAARRAVKWVALAVAALLAAPMVFGKLELNPWSSFSLLMVLAACALFAYTAAGHTGGWARFLGAGLILFDLYAFDWSARNKLEVARGGVDHLENLMSCRGAAAFLKAQPGPFRVQVDAGMPPNIGDTYGIETNNGTSATLLEEYTHVMRDWNLLNVRYILKPASAAEAGPVYQDRAWKVYENPGALPRAWVVHDIAVEREKGKLWERLRAPGMNARQSALMDAPLAARLDAATGAGDEVRFVSWRADRMSMNVRAEGRGLLVVSEIFYPGWEATVNGRPARLYRADGALRGVVVPAGQSRVELRYAPGSLYAGLAVTLLAFAGVFAARLMVGGAPAVQARPAAAARS